MMPTDGDGRERSGRSWGWRRTVVRKTRSRSERKVWETLAVDIDVVNIGRCRPLLCFQRANNSVLDLLGFDFRLDGREGRISAGITVCRNGNRLLVWLRILRLFGRRGMGSWLGAVRKIGDFVWCVHRSLIRLVFLSLLFGGATGQAAGKTAVEDRCTQHHMIRAFVVLPEELREGGVLWWVWWGTCF